MKSVLVVLLMFAALPAFAVAVAPTNKAQNQKICDALEAKISDDCDHLACDDLIADGTYKDLDDCTSASDYAEYAQGVCDGQPTIEDAVADYNQKNPAAHLTCE